MASTEPPTILSHQSEHTTVLTDTSETGNPPTTDFYSFRFSQLFQLESDTEALFQDWYIQSILPQIRLALYLGAGLFWGFWLLDWLLMEEHIFETILIRAPIGGLLIGTAFFGTKSSHFKTHVQLIVSTICVIAAIGLIMIMNYAPSPVKYLYYAGLMLVQMYATIFINLFVYVALRVNLFIIGSYIVYAVLLTENNPNYMINNVTFLISTAFMTLLARFWSERNERIIFLQQRDLSSKQKLLIKQNSDIQKALDDFRNASDKNAIFFAAYARATPGTSLEGKYLLEEQIGSGGLGTVYRATHRELEYEVAIKLLKVPDENHSINWFSRMKREAILANSIQHTNAVQIFDFGMANDVPYIIMELLKGESLEELLNREGSLSIQQCAEIIVPICDVLMACHQKGIIHRDVKPSNVFLHTTGNETIVKLIDFGIAKNIDNPEDQKIGNLTHHGFFVGTPEYSAPEVLRRESPTPKVDNYSLGVMLYKMLTATLLEQAPSYSKTDIEDISTLPPSTAHNPDLPPQIAEIIISLRAHDPRRRTSLKDLKTFLQTHQI